MNSSLLYILLILMVSVITGCSGSDSKKNRESDDNRNLKKATFAGGCFWCVESDFEKLHGVVKVISGYAGGKGDNPTYETYADMGYIEAVQVLYDPEVISYNELLDYFWKHIDPVDDGGQFADRGSHYRSEIFYHDDTQKKAATESKKDLDKSKRFKKPVVTGIVQFTNFTAAEDYHQNFCITNPSRYNSYRTGSGRDSYLKKTWSEDLFKIKHQEDRMYKKPDKSALKEKLTPLQCKVTQDDGTEPPFQNEYWDNKREGIYVDIVSGEPLFSSGDKFDSGTGWPSFSKPLEPANVVEKIDNTLFMKRTEVRSKHGDSHLGHLFPDGPKPTGLRYCMNSASMRFIPKEDMKKEGYEKYLKLFK